MPDPPQLPDVIQRAIDATNAGDTDAFVACFTDDAHVDDYGRDFHGHDGVRSWDSTDNVGVHMHFDVTGAEHDGDRWTVSMTARSERFNGAGSLGITLRGELIAELILG